MGAKNQPLENLCPESNAEAKIAELQTRVQRLEKVNRALMGRVERSTQGSANSFSLFESNILLASQVKSRTEALEKLNEAISSQREALFRTIQALPGQILIFNGEGAIVEAYSGKDVSVDFSKVKRIDDLFDSKFSNWTNQAAKRVAETALDFSFEHKPTSNKELRSRHYFCSISRLSEGLFLLYLRDTTQQILQEREIKEREFKENAALTALKLKSMFLATMSHEIRTPINGVIGMTGLLLDTKLNADQLEYVNTIKSCSNSLLNLINDILDFSKIEENALLIESHGFSLKEVISETLKSLKYMSNKASQLLRLEDRLPAEDYVLGDAGRLRQILTNLLANAIKFTTEGSVTLRVTPVESTLKHLQIRFEVVDTGIGISEEAQKSLFQPFFQADTSTTRNYGGTGLGLSISQRLVHLMGGEIGVMSREGVGSTFWFVLPLERPSKTEVPVATPGREISAESWVPERSFRVLVAEDNIVNQKVIQMQLLKFGLYIDVVANGAEALRALDMAPYDLVIMDCRMPDMDGFTASIKIRESQKPYFDIPIIALTANALKGDREKCFASGMDAYLSKPVKFADLTEALKQWLGGEENPISFETDFDMGLPQIDQQHHDLLMELNEFLRALYLKTDVSALHERIARFSAMIQVHFLEEERLMEREQFPGSADHAQLHRNFFRTLEKKRAELAAASVPDFKRAHRQMRLWFVQHVLEDDRRYAEYFREAIQKQEAK